MFVISGFCTACFSLLGEANFLLNASALPFFWHSGSYGGDGVLKIIILH
jgi:hypothetical protein